MRTRFFVILEHGLRGLCYVFLAIAVFGVLGGSSCYIVSCDDDFYYDDDDFDGDTIGDDDDDRYCGDDDDDDHHHHVHNSTQGSSASGVGGGLAMEAMIELGTRVVLPAQRTRTVLVPRWSARASSPRLATFQSERTVSTGAAGSDTLSGLRGIGPFGPVPLGPTGAELTAESFIEFGALFLTLNFDVLGLPQILGPWEPAGVEHLEIATLVHFQAVLPERGMLHATLTFDGFAVLELLHYQIVE